MPCPVRPSPPPGKAFRLLELALENKAPDSFPTFDFHENPVYPNPFTRERGRGEREERRGLKGEERRGRRELQAAPRD